MLNSERFLFSKALMFQIAGQIIPMSSDQPWQLGFKFLECQISVVTKGRGREGGREVSPAQYLYFLVRLPVCRRGAHSVSQCVPVCPSVSYLGNNAVMSDFSLAPVRPLRRTIDPLSVLAQCSSQLEPVIES